MWMEICKKKFFENGLDVLTADCLSDRLIPEAEPSIMTIMRQPPMGKFTFVTGRSDDRDKGEIFVVGFFLNETCSCWACGCWSGTLNEERLK